MTPIIPNATPRKRVMSRGFTIVTALACILTFNAVRGPARVVVAQSTSTREAQADANRQAYLSAADERDTKAAREARQAVAVNDESGRAFIADAHLDASQAPRKARAKKPRMVFGRPARDKE